MGFPVELRRLRYFLRIAAEGSLGRASRALGIAQPALSRQMQLLEAELGVALFQRVPKGMRLTEEGDFLREALSHPVQQIEVALKSVCSFSTRIEASCTLGLPPGIAELVGTRLVRRLGAEMPNLKLRLVEDHATRLAAALVRGTVDIAILSGVTPDDRLFGAEVLTELLLLVGSPDSELAGRRTLQLAELSRYPLILPPAPSTLPQTLDKLAARIAATLNVVHEIDSLEVTKDLVKAGAGFAILPEYASKAERAAGELVAVRIADPELSQVVHSAVQPHWRIARSTYNQFHRIFYEEWMSVVDTGEWPAKWLLDRELIAQSAAQGAALQ